MKVQPLPTIDDLIAEIAGIPIEELAKEPTDVGQHLISVDELRAAGALDVPAAWRKSLAPEARYTLPGFGDEDEVAESDEVARLDQPHETAPAPQRRQNRTHHRRAEHSTEYGEE